MTNHTTGAQRRNAKMEAIFDRAYEIAARAAGWAPTGPHGKWVLSGDASFLQGSYMPTERACRYICEDHDLLGLGGREAIDATPIGPQYVLPGAERITEAELAQRKAAESLKAAKPQRPCDHGLFSDAAAQADLCDLLKR